MRTHLLLRFSFPLQMDALKRIVYSYCYNYCLRIHGTPSALSLSSCTLIRRPKARVCYQH